MREDTEIREKTTEIQVWVGWNLVLFVPVIILIMY